MSITPKFTTSKFDIKAAPKSQKFDDFVTYASANCNAKVGSMTTAADADQYAQHLSSLMPLVQDVDLGKAKLTVVALSVAPGTFLQACADGTAFMMATMAAGPAITFAKEAAKVAQDLAALKQGSGSGPSGGSGQKGKAPAGNQITPITKATTDKFAAAWTLYKTRLDSDKHTSDSTIVQSAHDVLLAYKDWACTRTDEVASDLLVAFESKAPSDEDQEIPFRSFVEAVYKDVFEEEWTATKHNDQSVWLGGKAGKAHKSALQKAIKVVRQKKVVTPSDQGLGDYAGSLWAFAVNVVAGRFRDKKDPKKITGYGKVVGVLTAPVTAVFSLGVFLWDAVSKPFRSSSSFATSYAAALDPANVSFVVDPESI